MSVSLRLRSALSDCAFSALALFLASGLIASASAAPIVATPTASYLPAGTSFDAKVPTPEAHLGFEIGTRHLQHHQLVDYLRQLAKVSDRVKVEEYGRTHGERPLLLLTITSPANHQRLEDIRRERLAWANPTSPPDKNTKPEKLPVVINMGYSIHGNEPSGANAVPVVAYYLAAAQGEAIDELLANVIVLIDPCLNPDGFERFAHWTNNHRGAVPNADRNHREHQETFPSGRTNYYWFDLNRDWLPLTQPESQARMEWYHRWLPNVVLDFHEMGTDSTYFFQPGVPQRKNPWIPKANVELTVRLGSYHAAALDQIGSQYFTQDQFDDFYPGKGSTFPDLHGGVGILFEQGSSRGQVQESINGPVNFPFTIRNQVTTSLSSLAGTLALQSYLNEHQRTFYEESLAMAKKDPIRGYVVAAPGDPQRLALFANWLQKQRIAFEPLTTTISANGRSYRPGESILIPTEQPEYRFLQSAFEHRTEFEEPVFYDISAFNMPDSYGMDWAALEQWPSGGGAKPKDAKAKGKPKKSDPADQNHTLAEAVAAFQVAMPSPAAFAGNDAACLIDWRGYHAPRLLHQLHAQGWTVKVATEPFQVNIGKEPKTFGYGTLMLPLGEQRDKLPELQKLLQQAAAEGVASYAVASGLAVDGPDLGSRKFVVIKPVKVLLVVGEGASAYDTGTVWHLFDQKLRMPVTLVDTHRLGSTRLDDYTTVVVAGGSYRSVSAGAVEQLKRWTQEGGTLIALSDGIRWAKTAGLAEVNYTTLSAKDSAGASGRLPYAESERRKADDLVRGAILQAQIDHTHPLCYGYENRPLAVIRSHETFMQPAKNAYSSPVVYRERALLSGFMSASNQERASTSASAVVNQQGRGRVVLLSDNPTFRAHWLGTERLFVNAVFFGTLMNEP